MGIPTTRKTKRIIIACVVGLFAAGLAAFGLLAGTKAVATPKLGIAFVSVTNLPTGHIVATFAITNPHPRAVGFAPGAPQVRSPLRGMETILMFAASGGTVPAKGFTNFSMRVNVTTNSYWRVPFFTVFLPTKVEHWREILKENWRSYRETGTVIGLKVGYDLRGGTNYSEEFKVPYGL